MKTIQKFNLGDIAYMVESNYIIREGKIISKDGGFFLLRFTEGGGTRVKEHRLFKTEEEAQAEIDKIRANRRRA